MPEVVPVFVSSNCPSQCWSSISVWYSCPPHRNWDILSLHYKLEPHLVALIWQDFRAIDQQCFRLPVVNSGITLVVHATVLITGVHSAHVEDIVRVLWSASTTTTPGANWFSAGSPNKTNKTKGSRKDHLSHCLSCNSCNSHCRFSDA